MGTNPSRKEAFQKSLLYRLYATAVTTIVALVIFNPEMRSSLGFFFVADIILGIITFYTFERAWTFHQGLKNANRPESDHLPEYEQ